MSKNISIKEGDQGIPFGHIAKLKIPKSGGGSTLWVPEDEVGTKTLNAQVNGTYIAKDGSHTETKTTYVWETDKKGNKKKKKKTTKIIVRDPDDACYGYSEVSVNISDIVSGKIDDDISGFDDDDFDLDDGGNYTFDVGDEEFLEVTEMPTSIRIITPPTKLEYVEFDPVGIGGIVVHAYYENGEDWGEVPFEELRWNPVVAEFHDDSDGERDTTGTTLNSPIYLTPLSVGMYFGNLKIKSVTGQPYGININNRRFSIASFGDSQVVTARENGSYPEYYTTNSTYTYNGKEARYCAESRMFAFDARSDLPASTSQSQMYAGLSAAMALLQTKPLHPQGTQEITVSWEPLESGIELTDTYEITVIPFPIPDIGGGSGSGDDNGTGQWDHNQ